MRVKPPPADEQTYLKYAKAQRGGEGPVVLLNGRVHTIWRVDPARSQALFAARVAGRPVRGRLSLTGRVLIADRIEDYWDGET